MLATLLVLYRNYKKWAGLNTQGRLHQQPRKDPVNGLKEIGPKMSKLVLGGPGGHGYSARIL
jgi:hypothetical protein